MTSHAINQAAVLCVPSRDEAPRVGGSVGSGVLEIYPEVPKI